MEHIQIYVGLDRSQWLGFEVLAHSIRRHTQAAVSITPMMDLDVPVPRDPQQDQRTGFSFSRFCIPKVAGYRGKAIYMDADMLVFRDVRELWNLPFVGAKVLIQEDLTPYQAHTGGKRASPKSRIKQCSVMSLDCARLDWEIEEIVEGLDRGAYDYEGLMYHLCLLKENEVAWRIPFRWNSLEHHDESTCLIHYTDMPTQPWVSSLNKHGNLWIRELRLMLEAGKVSMDVLQKEVSKGYVRPSLLKELQRNRRFALVPGRISALWDWSSDRLIKGFRSHKMAHQERIAQLKGRRASLGLLGSEGSIHA